MLVLTCQLTVLIVVTAACAFWMLFGGDKTPEQYQGRPDARNHTIEVEGMGDPNAMLFSLFRLTLVDEYDYGVSITGHV